MKSEIDIKRIDSLGRIRLTNEIRRLANINKGDYLEFCTHEDAIVLVKQCDNVIAEPKNCPTSSSK